MFTLEFSVPVTYENLLDFFEVKNDRNAIVVNDDSMV
jgi:sulfur carrier protein ThiS